MPVPSKWVISEPWVIIDKTTGRYIVSNTQREPMELTGNRSPRLFLTERSAKGFIGQWCRGSMYLDRDGDIHVRPVPKRSKANMVIVQLQLVHVP